MYIVIKRDKSDELKHKVKELKELACCVMDCLDEAYSDSKEYDNREYSRRESRHQPRRRKDDYDSYDDYDEDYERRRDFRMRY